MGFGCKSVLELRPGNGVGGAAVGGGWNGRNRVAHVCCPEPSCAGSGRNSVCLGIEALKNKSVKISAVFSRMAVFWKKLCAGDT